MSKEKASSHFVTIILERWPWQEQRWAGRFGGGWRWCLGVQIGAGAMVLDLVFGSIRFSWGANRQKEAHDSGGNGDSGRL